MTAMPQSAWALLSKPILLVNGTLILVSAGAFQWVLPRLPERITLQVDLYGQPGRPGSPHELWIMGAIMAISLGLPVIAAVAASAGALDPLRHPQHRPLLFAHRRQTVRMVEGLVLGINLTISSAWLGLSVGQLPSYALPGDSLLPIALGVMAAAMMLPLLFLLPQHLKLTRMLQDAVGEAHNREELVHPPLANPPLAKASFMEHSQDAPKAGLWLQGQAPAAYSASERRMPLWLVLLVLPSLALLLSVWLSP